MLAYKQASTSFLNPGFVLSARGLAVSEDARIRTEIEHPLNGRTFHQLITPPGRHLLNRYLIDSLGG